MTQRRAVLFVDAENVPSGAAGKLVEEATRHGLLLDRRVYGDFSNPSLKPWLDAAALHALTTRQTVAGANGKNGADIAMVIDAMDELHSGHVDVFCLATADSDFTQLAMRIRRAGKIAVGMACSKASSRFQAAFDVFRIVDAVKANASSVSVKAGEKPVAKQAPAVRRALKGKLLQRIFVEAPPLDGPWVALPDLMKTLQACQPNFDLKAYGHNQFYKLLAFSDVELADKNRKARLKAQPLKKVVDNG
jgi:hypothetical protein